MDGDEPTKIESPFWLEMILPHFRDTADYERHQWVSPIPVVMTMSPQMPKTMETHKNGKNQSFQASIRHRPTSIDEACSIFRYQWSIVLF